MGTNEKILLAAIGIAAGVGGYIYVKRKGGIDAVLNNSGNNMPTTTQTNFSSGTRPQTNFSSGTRPQTNFSSGGGTSVNPNYTTDSKTRTRTIQKLLFEGGYLASSRDVDGIWGARTDSAFKKATSERNLSPITNETSYLEWVRRFNGGTSSDGSSGGSNIRGIAAYINTELRSISSNYSEIRRRLAPLTAKQIADLDRIYREYSPKGLVSDFRPTEQGGKVSSNTFNVDAIRDILNSAGLKGLANVQALAGLI